MKLMKKIALFALAALTFGACEDVPAPYTLPGENTGGSTLPEGTYIDEKFSTEFGVFTPIETEGSYPWIIDYNTAKATSYDGVNNNPAQSWLVSDPVDFTNETEAYVSFDYIIRYAESGKVAANHQLLISADYAGDPAAATWTNVPYNAVEGIDWNTFYNASVAVPADFIGKANIVFALKYTAKSKSGTWEVKNFIVAHGTPKAPEEPEEAGVYTVSEAIEAFSNGTAGPAVVTGYIVGTIDGQVYTEGCNFSGTATVKTNLLLADNAEETDCNNCIPVQLPSGAVRDALNLVDNSGYYKKQVKLTGSLEKYFGVAGLKSVTKYEIDGVTPEEPETPADAYISETFATSFGTFSTQETVGNFPWVIDFSCAKATGYYDSDGDSKGDANGAAESWLISSAIDFTNETEAYISFDYVIRFTQEGKVAEHNQLLISTDYTGDAATATWTAINYNAKENTADWSFGNSGKIAIPAEFMGKANVRIAFKYTSTETKAGTWEVKNLIVAHGTGDNTGTTEPEEPETPDTPEGVSTIADVLSAGAGSATVQGTIVATYSRGFIVNDGTASILAYLGEDKGYNEGDVVKVSGETSVYAGLLQFGAGSTVEKVGTATVTHPTAIEMDGAAMDNYLSTPSIKYITYRGVLEINGNYYNVEIADSETAIGSISYPKSGVVDASLNGKEIIVTGYAIGVSRSEFVNTMAVKVEAAEGGTTEPEEPETPDTPDTPAGEEVVFDFTNPTALDPSVKPSADVSTGVEFETITFNNSGISIKLDKGTATTNVRIWTKTDGTYELRTYNGSTMTISAPEGTDISSIVFNGGKITTMSPDSGTFSDGTWSGSANSVTFSVTGTLNIKTITVK